MKKIILLLSLIMSFSSFANELKEVKSCRDAYNAAITASKDNSLYNVGEYSTAGVLGTGLVMGMSGPILLPVAAVGFASGPIVYISRVAFRTPNIKKMVKLIDGAKECVEENNCSSKRLSKLHKYIERKLDREVPIEDVAIASNNILSSMQGCIRDGKLEYGYRSFGWDENYRGYRLKRFRHIKKDVLNLLK